jgi:hypothetical protein
MTQANYALRSQLSLKAEGTTLNQFINVASPRRWPCYAPRTISASARRVPTSPPRSLCWIGWERMKLRDRVMN